ncbi:hypothetical protein GCM10027091_62880 [Streptomyces daliensis]
MQKVQESYEGARFERDSVTAVKRQLQEQMATPTAINEVSERERQAQLVTGYYRNAVQEFQRANIQTAADLRSKPRAQVAYNTAVEAHAAYVRNYPSEPGQSVVSQNAGMTNRMAADQAQGSGPSHQSPGAVQGQAPTRSGRRR